MSMGCAMGVDYVVFVSEISLECLDVVRLCMGFLEDGNVVLLYGMEQSVVFVSCMRRVMYVLFP